MKTSRKGKAFLANKEGITIAPYLDSVGVWTWGLGHTAAAGFDPAKMNKAVPSNIMGAVYEAVDVFNEDILTYEQAVNDALTVSVKQHQFDALVSFHYNTGGIHKASLVRKLNAGDITGAGKGFMGWRKPASIIDRRKAEQKLFRTGEYGSLDVPIRGTNGKGAVRWKPIDIIDGLDLFKAPAVDTPKQNWLAVLLAAIRGMFK